MKRIALLGCTGSIGQQTLDVISKHPTKFELISLASGRGSETLAQQINQFKPKRVGVSDENAAKNLQNFSLTHQPEFVFGKVGLVALAQDPEVDMVVVATSGQHGFAPTLAAIEAGKKIALANKEVLIMAGELVTEAARAKGVQIRPIDSEHSAIWQSLVGENPVSELYGEEDWSSGNPKVHRLILTASGGPFRTFTREMMANVTVEQAMKHPNWNMGPKITIDSSTLFNKGLEVIEAHWLFGFSYDQIDVVVHPPSIIHSMVEFIDGAIKAQLGTPDMRTPIQYALGYPERLPNDYPRLDFARMRDLTFELPDFERFPALRLAYEAGRKGGSYPTVLAAADEEAVRLFSERQIPYLGIAETVERTLEAHTFIAHPTLEDIAETDAWARRTSVELATKSAILAK
jgi:1-deoxy-D-xylulose-5-phosphate reductoisomerase